MAAAELSSFLIADIRGYTAFTRSRGDEAAAALAGKFAQVAREGIEAQDGRLLELLGDEALAVFTPSRASLRAAVALQEVFADETRLEPDLPLTGRHRAGRRRGGAGRGRLPGWGVEPGGPVVLAGQGRRGTASEVVTRLAGAVEEVTVSD